MHLALPLRPAARRAHERMSQQATWMFILHVAAVDLLRLLPVPRTGAGVPWVPSVIFQLATGAELCSCWGHIAHVRCSTSHLDVAVTTKWMSGRRSRRRFSTASLPTPDGPETMTTSAGGGETAGALLKGPSCCSTSCSCGDATACGGSASVADWCTATCWLELLLELAMPAVYLCVSCCFRLKLVKLLPCNAGSDGVRWVDVRFAVLQRQCNRCSTVRLWHSMSFTAACEGCRRQE